MFQRKTQVQPPSPLRGELETPASGESVYDEVIPISGWIDLSPAAPESVLLRAEIDGVCVAESRLLSRRPEIATKLGLAPETLLGFRMLGRMSLPGREPREVRLRIVFSLAGSAPQTLLERPLRLLPASLGERPHGNVVHPTNATLLHRENIYGSGPPQEQPGSEAMNLILAWLPERSSVVDIGCGAGAYGPELIAAGHDWLGLEPNEHCCEILSRRELPFRRVEAGAEQLPGADGEWENGICIEVLEHIAEPNAFLREIARVTRKRVLFSVPNLEVLPYLHGWAVVPWHLLEADHKNFFTRKSLQALLSEHFRVAEVFPYEELPLRTRDGIALYGHLFAVAEK